MNIEELEAIIDKYDSKELWVDPPSFPPGVPNISVPTNENILARRKIVLSALAQIEEIISGSGEVGR